MNEDFIDFLLGIAASKVEEGRFAAAREMLEKLSSLNPDNPFVHEHIGALYLRIGEKNKSKLAFQKALDFYDKRVNENPTVFFHKKGLMHILLEEHEKAEAALKKSLKLNENNLLAWAQLAHVQEKLGKPYNAIKSLREALKLLHSNKSELALQTAETMHEEIKRLGRLGDMSV